MNARLLLGYSLLTAMALAAPAAVTDNFESYALGSNLHGQDNWEGWDGVTNAGALVSDAHAFSGRNSVAITGASDLVRKFSGISGGKWVLSIKQFIPADFTGNTYFILLNRYALGNQAWSVQIQHDSAGNRIVSDNGGSAALPLIKDRWVDYRFEISLDANIVAEYYNNQLLSTHAWYSADGSPTIAAIDLFANGASPVYYDDLCLSPVLEPGTAGASIGYVGADINTGGSWRTSGVPKPLDGDADNIYGTDGYVLTTSPGGDVLSNPAYASIARAASSTFYNGHITEVRYQAMDNPAGGDQVIAGLWFSSGTVDLEEQELAEIMVTAASGFRIGVLVDQTDVADISPKHLRLRQVQGGTADTGSIDAYLEPNLDSDWYFFDVVGAQPGDRFVLSGTNMRAGSHAQDSNGIGAITFDRIPAKLELQLYAGLNISGTVGTMYSIQYATDLATNVWTALNSVQLPTSPYLWIDISTPAAGQRFYRALPIRPQPANP